MATFTCPACQRCFDHLEDQDGPCPACGALWNIRAGEQSYVVDGVDIRRLARQQRWMVLLVLLVIVTMIGLGYSFSMAMSWGLWAFLAVLVIVRLSVAVGTAMMMATMKWNVVLIIFLVLLMLVDGVNLVILVVTNSLATNTLRRAGLSVGFVGVSDEQVLKRLSRGLCRKCGYDLTGNVTGRCPECGEALPLAVAVPIAEVQAIPGPPPKIDEA